MTEEERVYGATLNALGTPAGAEDPAIQADLDAEHAAATRSHTTCGNPSPATPDRRCQHTVIDGLHHGDHEHYDPATNTVSHWPNKTPGAHRNRTPNRHDASTGQTTITVQRCCNGCGRSLGDATPIEIAWATLGVELPDVTGECAVCSGR